MTTSDATLPADAAPAGSDPAERLIEKLRGFASGLDPEERQLLAALLAPGIDAAWASSEVSGFALDWSPTLLPDHLADTIRGRNLRVEGW
jgi:hypothetical protein